MKTCIQQKILCMPLLVVLKQEFENTETKDKY